MTQNLIRGAILGGIVAFVWSNISWTLIPWHDATLHKFTNEGAVERALAANATAPGIYVLPGNPITPGMTSEQKKAAEAAAMERMKHGPIVFTAIRTSGMTGMAAPMGTHLLTMIVGALMMTWLLLQTRGLAFGARARFVAVAALAGGVINTLPNWTWWGFSGGYTLVGLLDVTIGWLLAGLAIAKWAYPKTA